MADNWQLKAVLSAVDKMSPVLKQVSGVAKTTRKYLSDVAGAANKLTSKIGLPLTALSGVLGGFSLVAIKNAVVGFTDMGEEIYKASLRTGMSVEQLQRMKYVSEQAGVPIESLEIGMAKLNKQIGDATAGKNKDLAGLMKKLGIDMREANGQLKAGIDILPQLSDAFVRNKNPVVQARMGMALFGKSWQEMVPLLMEGADGINSSLDRFKRLKGVMNLADLKGAKDLGDKFKDLEFVTKGFQNTIAKELIPVLGPVIEDIIQWGVANRKLVSSGVKEFARELVQGMREVDWTGIIEGTKRVIGSLGTLVDWLGGTKNALIVLAVVINAQTIMALVGLVGAVGRAGLAFLAMAGRAYVAGNASVLAMARVVVMAVATAGPIGAIGAAFTWVAGIATGAGGIISGALGMVGVAIRAIGAALMANPLGIILALATAAYLIYQNWDTLKKWFSGFFGWLSENFTTLLAPITAIGAAFTWIGGFAASAGSVITGALGSVGVAIRAVGAALMANPLGIVLALATAAYLIYKNWDALKTWFSGFFDWVGDKFKGLVGWAVDMAKAVGRFFGMGAAAGDSTAVQAAAKTANSPAAASAISLAGVAATGESPAVQAAVKNANSPATASAISLAGGPAAGTMAQPGRVVGAERPSLITPATQVKASGQIEVSFKDAPAGMRVEQSKTSGDIPINTNVGYRSYAMGMP